MAPAEDAAEQATRVKAAEQRAQQWEPKPGNLLFFFFLLLVVSGLGQFKA